MKMFFVFFYRCASRVRRMNIRCKIVTSDFIREVT